MDVRLIGVGNIGNLRRVKIINADEVVLIMHDGVRVLDLVYKVDVPEVHNIYVVPGDASFEQTEGNGWVSKVVLKSSGDFVDAAKFSRIVKNKKWLVLIEDNNSLVRLVGTLKQPLRCAVKYDSGNRSRVYEFGGVTYREALYGVDIEGVNSFDAVFGGEWGSDFSSDFN
jgi:hypothetical protein